jgi:hypothetical protein
MKVILRVRVRASVRVRVRARVSVRVRVKILRGKKFCAEKKFAPKNLNSEF